MADQEVTETMGMAEGFEEPLVKTIERLAALPPLEYERVRIDEAKRLKMRASVLEREVKAARKNGRDENDLGLFEPEPWPEPVDGNNLLDQLCRTFKRYLALPQGADVILALWTVHAHSFDTGMVSPRLVIKSPEKRCGKTTALTILGRLVPRS